MASWLVAKLPGAEMTGYLLITITTHNTHVTIFFLFHSVLQYITLQYCFFPLQCNTYKTFFFFLSCIAEYKLLDAPHHLLKRKKNPVGADTGLVEECKAEKRSLYRVARKLFMYRLCR